MKTSSTDLQRRVLNAVRDYGVHLTIFRNAMSEWAGVNPTDMECLRQLFMKGQSTPSELARQTGLTSGAATAMLDRLEKGGFIERHPNPNDRRGTIILPVEASGARMAGWFASARQAQAELVAGYSDEELEIIAGAFEKFTELWQRETGKIQSDK